MKRFVPPSITVLAVFALAYPTFYQWLVSPGVNQNSIPSILGVVFLSLLVAGAANFATFWNIYGYDRRLSSLEKQNAARIARISYPLLQGLEDLLRRRVEEIRDSSELFRSVECNQHRPIAFHVQVYIDGYHRIIASTVEEHDSVRRQALDQDEGIVGYAVWHQASYVLAEKESDELWRVFNRSGEEIGSQGPLATANQETIDPELRWITVTPIYDQPQEAPWSNKINGVLSVSAYHPSAGDLFTNLSFQRQVEAARYAVEHFVEAFIAVRDANSFDSYK